MDVHIRKGGHRSNLETVIGERDNIEKGQLNPDWVEWLMGWPIFWTSLEPIKELTWLDWSVDPADRGSMKKYPTPTINECFRYGHNQGGAKEKKFIKDAGSGPIPRVATGIKDIVARLKAIGNGQVPQTAATAWKILTNEETI